MDAPPKTLPKLCKIKPLDGTKRWSQKLLLYFEQLEIDCILTIDLLDDTNTTTDAEPSTPAVPKTPSIPLDDATKMKLEKDNKLARSYLLNNMSNPLFDLFVNSNLQRLYGPN